MLGAPSLSFGLLIERLKVSTRLRIRNGEFTERGLASRVGLSQPHMHHVLSGQRTLTAEVADQILMSLEASVSDLLDDSELSELVEQRAHLTALRSIPIAAGRLGPDDPFPDFTRFRDWLYLPPTALGGIRRPCLVELAQDLALGTFIAPGSFALLELDEAARLRAQDGAWFVLRWSGAGALRQLRRQPGRLFICGQQTLPGDNAPAVLPLSERSLLQVVRARLMWIGPDPRRAGPFDYAGNWLAAERS